MTEKKTIKPKLRIVPISKRTRATREALGILKRVRKQVRSNQVVACATTVVYKDGSAQHDWYYGDHYFTLLGAIRSLDVHVSDDD